LEQEITSKLNANKSRVIETKLKDYYGVTEQNQTNLRESDYNEANTIGNALEF
jgi:L-ribulose-5-phosphate 3-epimerase UlaE